MALSGWRALKRTYGMWWDTINTGTAILTLFFLFFWLSIGLITDALGLFPFYEEIWEQLENNVSAERRAELGLGILSVAVSGASAAVLFLIKEGTRRWAMNRRIGLFHLYSAEETLALLNSSSARGSHIERALAAFLDGSQYLYDDINAIHPEGQVGFETLRLKALNLRGTVANREALESLAVDQLHIALICLGKVRPIATPEFVEKWFADICKCSCSPASDLRHRSLSARGRLERLEESLQDTEYEVEDGSRNI